jgi:hypothetical protein
MRSAGGFAVAAVGALLLLLGAWATITPGEREPEGIRSLGVTMLVLGALVALGATMILRSRK